MPERVITEGASNIHGLTCESLRDLGAQPFAVVRLSLLLRPFVMTMAPRWWVLFWRLDVSLDSRARTLSRRDESEYHGAPARAAGRARSGTLRGFLSPSTDPRESPNTTAMQCTANRNTRASPLGAPLCATP